MKSNRHKINKNNYLLSDLYLPLSLILYAIINMKIVRAAVAARNKSSQMPINQILTQTIYQQWCWLEWMLLVYHPFSLRWIQMIFSILESRREWKGSSRSNDTRIRDAIGLEKFHMIAAKELRILACVSREDSSPRKTVKNSNFARLKIFPPINRKICSWWWWRIMIFCLKNCSKRKSNFHSKSRMKTRLMAILPHLNQTLKTLSRITIS